MKEGHSYIFYVALIILVALPLVIKSDYDLHILIMVGIFSLLAMGFNVMFGYIGQLSLGHTAFFAIGAYTSALTTLKWGISCWLGIALAALITGIFGFLIGIISLRWRSHFFIIATVCFWGIIHLIIINSISVTNGPVGIRGIPVPVLGNMVLSSKVHFYYLLLFFVFASFWFTRKIILSPIGRTFRAIRENESLAESVGISAFRYATFAFVFSTVLAGIAGAVYAHYITYVSPEICEFSLMITILVMVVIGGRGTTIGPLLGALIIVLLEEYLRFAKDYRLPIFGFILILGIVFLPNGIVSLPRIVSSFWRREK